MSHHWIRWLMIILSATIFMFLSLFISVPTFYGLMTLLERYGYATFYTFPSILHNIGYISLFLIVLYVTALIIEMAVTMTMTLMFRQRLTNRTILYSTVIQAGCALFILKFSIDPLFEQFQFSWIAAIVFIGMYYSGMYYLSGDDRFEERSNLSS